MVNRLEQSFFNYSLRFDDDYKYLWGVLEQVSSADIDIMTSTSKDAEVLLKNFVRQVYGLKDR